VGETPLNMKKAIPHPDAKGRPMQPGDDALSAHILPTSATMIGVCMTVMSLSHLSSSTEFRWIIHKLLAGDTMIFLASALLSFCAMRQYAIISNAERKADVVFVFGLVVMVVIVFLIAMTIS
jgi:hypothetical protein